MSDMLRMMAMMILIARLLINLIAAAVILIVALVVVVVVACLGPMGLGVGPGIRPLGKPVVAAFHDILSVAAIHIGKYYLSARLTNGGKFHVRDEMSIFL